MSATRTFAALKASAFIVGDSFDEAVAEAARQNHDQAAYQGVHASLGGSNAFGIVNASYEEVADYQEHTLNGASFGGLTLEAVVFYRTAAAGTSVQVRVRNTSDSSNAATGTSSASTSVVKEVLTLTMASGDKVYRLEVVGGNTSAPVFAWGYFRIRKVPS